MESNSDMKDVVNLLIEKKMTIATMESCTGGFVVSSITDIDGSSNVLKFSAVTYSNEYKIKMGVSKEVIDKYSVYSINVAREMAKKISNFAHCYTQSSVAELKKHGFHALASGKRRITSLAR